MSIAPTTRAPLASGAKDLSIETLRGLACVLLVLYHTVGADRSLGLKVEDGTLLRWLTDSMLFLRMPLFTFLSGIVYAMRPAYAHWGGFVSKKLRRLMVPMFFVGTIYLLVKLAMPEEVNRPYVLPIWQWHIVIPIEHYWYLEATLVLFAMIAAIDHFRLAESRRAAVAWMIGAAAFSAVVGPFVAEVRVFSLMGIVYLLPFFLLGVFARRFDWRGAPAAVQVGAGLVAVALIGVSQLGVAGAIPDIQERYTPLVILLSGAACLTLFSTRWTWRPLAFVGAYSYAIFLLHVFASAGSRIVLMRLGVDDTYILLVVGMVAALGLPILVQEVCGYSRVLRLLILGQAWRGPVKRLRRTAAPSSLTSSD
ncbi:acyltransferase family protein [Leifsonia shinshuensis]|uniref:acyltransferase family protein n=1 Tax=Leifsonia shinshuensis TaxID=150026 RepID=UPI0016285E52|nr:acyltransferase [Leifsonia shinshuensis]